MMPEDNRKIKVPSAAKCAWDKEEQARQNLEARDARWMEIFRKGGGLRSEMFQADYGTESPVGLDVELLELDSFIKF